MRAYKSHIRGLSQCGCAAAAIKAASILFIEIILLIGNQEPHKFGDDR